MATITVRCALFILIYSSSDFAFIYQTFNAMANSQVNNGTHQVIRGDYNNIHGNYKKILRNYEGIPSGRETPATESEESLKVPQDARQMSGDRASRTPVAVSEETPTAPQDTRQMSADTASGSFSVTTPLYPPIPISIPRHRQSPDSALETVAHVEQLAEQCSLPSPVSPN